MKISKFISLVYLVLHKPLKLFLNLNLFLCLLLFSPLCFAYGPNGVGLNGQALKQAHPLAIPFNIENGALEDLSESHAFHNQNDIHQYCQTLSQSLRPPTVASCQLRPFFSLAQAQTNSNSIASNIVRNSLLTWEQDPYSDVHFVESERLVDDGDVNICNIDRFINYFTPYSGPNDERICGCIEPRPVGCSQTCKNPIIFDPNGDLIDYLFAHIYGVSPENEARTTVLALASPVAYPFDHPTQYISFHVIINGACLGDSPSPLCGTRRWANEDIQALLTHEIGHALGLDHTLVLPYSEASDLVRLNQDNIPTMFPLYLTREQKTLHADDLAGLRWLYPSALLNPLSCSVEGNFQIDGLDQRCAEIVAQKINRSSGTAQIDYSSSLEVLSGEMAVNNGMPSYRENTCSSNCGLFSIQNLEVGAEYKIVAQSLMFSPTSNLSMSLCGTHFPSFTNRVLAESVRCSSAGQVIHLR